MFKKYLNECMDLVKYPYIPSRPGCSVSSWRVFPSPGLSDEFAVAAGSRGMENRFPRHGKTIFTTDEARYRQQWEEDSVGGMESLTR